jgi:hypothetical protein
VFYSHIVSLFQMCFLKTKGYLINLCLRSDSSLKLILKPRQFHRMVFDICIMIFYVLSEISSLYAFLEKDSGFVRRSVMLCTPFPPMAQICCVERRDLSRPWATGRYTFLKIYFWEMN